MPDRDPAGGAAGGAGRAEEQVESPARVEAFVLAEDVPRSGAAGRGGGDGLPWIGRPEGGVRAAPDGDARPQETGAAPQVRPVVGIDIGQVVVAPLGDEGRLGHDGEAVGGDAGRFRCVHHGAVLDAVAGPGARLVPRGQGEEEPDSGDAMDGHGAARPVDPGDAATRSSRSGRRWSATTSLTGPRSSSAPAGRVEPRPAGHHDLLRQCAFGDGAGQQRQVLDLVLSAWHR